jgi:hypothetical protein
LITRTKGNKIHHSQDAHGTIQPLLDVAFSLVVVVTPSERVANKTQIIQPTIF